jgi:two-component system, OmpR family, sensor histidine kinase KdpD
MTLHENSVFSISTSLAAVVLVTLVFGALAFVNATTVGFAYLITVLLIAASWGIVESVLASILAALCFSYYFLPPFGFAIAAPEDWIALAAFLLSSLVASNLSSRARRRTDEANARQAEMEKLYELSRAIMLMGGDQPVGDQLANEVVRICQIPAVAIYDRAADMMYTSGETPVEMDARLKNSALTNTQSTDAKTGTSFVPITLAGHNTGSVAIRGGELSDTALRALLNLMAITLENARSREIATRAQAARQSEQFKSTLLDGLAHEFKTPLTSIRGAATALLASNVSDARQQLELLTIVDQEAERLARLVTEATHVARIEAGKIQVNRHWHRIGSIVDKLIAETEVQRDGRRIHISIPENLPHAWVDANLIQLALRQLVDNALKYSPRKSAIAISAVLADGNLAISVQNEGEPLSESERTRIFDKFYRGQNVRHLVAGTGMGLPVAREILLAHGGDVFLNRSSLHSTEFVATIPVSGPQGEGI